jgi:hypothetical protein
VPSHQFVTLETSFKAKAQVVTIKSTHCSFWLLLLAASRPGIYMCARLSSEPIAFFAFLLLLLLLGRIYCVSGPPGGKFALIIPALGSFFSAQERRTVQHLTERHQTMADKELYLFSFFLTFLLFLASRCWRVIYSPDEWPNGL